MTNVFDIALVFSPHEWVETLHRHCTNTGSLRIRALVYDSIVLETESYEACVISDSHPALNSSLVKSLHDTNKIVIGVCDDSSNARDFLAEIGVDGIFSSRSSAEELSLQIQLFLENDISNSHVDLKASTDFEYLDDLEISNPDSNYHDTKTVSVIGAGGTGATELALVLASRLIDSVIVDVDFEHPSLAPRTGLSVEPHIIGAIESATNDFGSFVKFTQRIRSSAVVVGTSHASFARDIRNYELESLLKALTANYTNIVLDHGRVSEDSAFFETHRYLLEKSNIVVVVGEPTPLGTLRILENIALLNSMSLELNQSFEICVVINKSLKSQQTIDDVYNEINDIEQVSFVTSLPYVSDFFKNSWQSTIGQPKSWKKHFDQLLIYLSHFDDDRSQIISFNEKMDKNVADQVQASA